MFHLLSRRLIIAERSRITLERLPDPFIVTSGEQNIPLVDLIPFEEDSNEGRLR